MNDSEGKAVVSWRDGRRSAVTAGECLGQQAAVHGGAYDFDAVATSEVFAWGVNHTTLRIFLEGRPDLARKVFMQVPPVAASRL